MISRRKTLSSTSTHNKVPQHQTGQYVRPTIERPQIPHFKPASQSDQGGRGLISSSIKWFSSTLIQSLCYPRGCRGKPKDVAEERGRPGQTGRNGAEVGDQPRGASMAAPFGNFLGGRTTQKACPGTFSQSLYLCVRRISDEIVSVRSFDGDLLGEGDLGKRKRREERLEKFRGSKFLMWIWRLVGRAHTLADQSPFDYVI